ncbi:tagaturonate reductase [Fulvivirga maritima]|uniref:tagaturonate reductase n=1 Tax=Fulvivirga maritima TaxID=2904247 RepID=UPI001F1BDC2B|nr:tagaturonate reductase [Fulvivirga maritima]UII27163.1 tagaturonate reductase [Fulvivirga maritima]
MKPLNKQTAGVSTQPPVKVLQFGEGNFLRAFVDWVIDILNEKANFNGSVHIVQPIAQGMVNMLNDQDCLYHVLLQGIKNGNTIDDKRLITSIYSASNPYDDYKAYLALGENPELEFMISNTTEAGIKFSEVDESSVTLPDTFPGKLTALLYHRYKFFKGAADKGLTLIPCELIEHNGTTLKKTIMQYIQHWHLPDDFALWIENHNRFCNTLVDRIVPGFPRENIKEIQTELDFEDNLVVKAEPFLLWVIEAPEGVKEAFPTYKTDLDVLFVKDITPYRTRKVRILNGAHTSLVPVAYLHGVRTVREAVENDYTGAFIKKTIFEEIVPTLDLPAEELEKFANAVLERFKNPFISHELISIALNSVSKYKVRVLPSLLEYKKRKGSLPENLVHALAALIVFYRGEWNGESIALNDSDDVLTFFKEIWNGKQEEIAPKVLSNTAFWDLDLSQVAGLSAAVQKEISSILLSEKEKSY